MHKTKKALSLTAIAMVTLALTINATCADVLFSDDFESPDVDPGYDVVKTSQQIDETKWVRSIEGYNSKLNGIVDEAENNGANFTDPVGSQAYATRYTNTGLTTAVGVIGALKAGVTYTVTFDVVVDGSNKGSEYNVGLLTFAPDAIRSDTSTTSSKDIPRGASAIIASASGAASGATYEKKSFSYTADGTEATLGQDLAVRIAGGTNSANIDNVSVSSNLEGSSSGAAVVANNSNSGGSGPDFATWIAGYPSVGDMAAFDDDADGDGIVNGLENFFGTAPDKVTEGLVANEPRERAKNQFTFTHPENPTPAKNISEPVYMWTTNQKTFQASGEKAGHTTITFKRATNTPSAGITTVTGIVTGPVPPNISVNVRVTLKP